MKHLSDVTSIAKAVKHTDTFTANTNTKSFQNTDDAMQVTQHTRESPPTKGSEVYDAAITVNDLSSSNQPFTSAENNYNCEDSEDC